MTKLDERKFQLIKCMLHLFNEIYENYYVSVKYIRRTNNVAFTDKCLSVEHAYETKDLVLEWDSDIAVDHLSVEYVH